MRKVIMFCLVTFVICASTAFANIIHVPGDCPTIQAGIDTAMIGDTVMVAAGTYYENLIISQQISLLGEHRDNVIINGSGTGDVVYIEANNVTVGNLTITNSGTGIMDVGLELDHADNCVIELCKFSGNYVGFELYGSSFNRISRCIFESNTYGIRFWEIEDPFIQNYENIIENNVFNINTEIGIWFDHTAGTHHHSGLVWGNRISDNNIGISMIMSMQNDVCFNHIEDNYSWGITHGVCEGGGGQNTFHHNNFIENHGDTLQAMNLGIGDDLWYCSPLQEGNHWSDYTGPDNNGDGIGDTPQDIFGDASVDMYPFMNPLEAATEGVVMDAAWQPVEGALVEVLGTEIESITNDQGQYYLPGLKGGNYDLQVTHENYQDTIVTGVPSTLSETTTWDIVLRIITGVNDDEPIPSRYLIAWNYPNPFNASTTIEYSLPAAANVTIEIFDILGRKVETLFDGYQQAGQHRLTWDAADMSSGVYLYKINAGGLSETKQMLLLK